MNIKFLLRFSPIFLLVLAVFLKLKWEHYSILMFSAIVLNTILSYPRKSFYSFNKYYSVVNYSSWLIFIVTIVFVRSLGFNYEAVAILLLRVFILMLNYFKFRNFYIPTTFLNLLWAFSFSLYLMELVLNSTHGTKSLFMLLGIISGIETILIIILLKDWREKISSLLFFLKRNNRMQKQ
ncbi:hypothetical protein RT99_19870 [Flavobacterium sp. MEB061]|uniref:hypothetical protein n=1 Tax=Flavobacterium sp. MEB061 TaxID=1587524 RepID=UPI0005AC1A29|nr:hypothetical protein [Flavobacterium sp. MEB061]KIQ16909.1 hypothetical protein RT99_19870 [Flavobacterium sp. MEB061]